MRLDIKVLSETITEYNNLFNKLEETKTGLEEAVSTLTANGWSGTAKISYEQAFEYTMHCYKQFEEDFVKRMKKVLEKDTKARASALKNRCEDFENCILGSEKGIYGEDCGGTSGIISLEYDNVTKIGENTTDITFDLVQKEQNKLRDISDTIRKHGWFSNGGLRYCSFNVDNEVSQCATVINKEKERIANFNQSFGRYYNGIQSMEDTVASGLKILIDDVAKDVTRDYYTPIDCNSNNYDWDRIKGLMELDPDLISNDDYDDLMKIYTKMADDDDKASMERFIENSYIYIGPQNAQRDLPLDCYTISPVYKEMSNRYKLMAELMVEGAGNSILSEKSSEESKKIRKYISNSDILSSVIKHASVVDASTIESGHKIDVTIKGHQIYKNNDYEGNNYDISINGKIPKAKDEDTNIKFTVFELSDTQNDNIAKATQDKLKSMKKDLTDVVEDVGKDYVKGKVTDFMEDSVKDVVKGIAPKAAGYVGVAADVLNALNDINEKYTEVQDENKGLNHSANMIDIGRYTDALAINSSVSVGEGKDGTAELESTYVNLDETKFRIWYYRNHGDENGSGVKKGDTSIENYVNWYEGGGKKHIEQRRDAEKIQTDYKKSEESEIKSLKELLQGSDVKSDVIESVDK
ncbi:hypothetical protein [Clostridium uliginosum]|uniref:WXG100 family type VII secretion target n=1 Tax=Clostridium uliginosum TaxID=119641 RepID=A0A1I1PN92_9CLOT|nr:hypothetical protein [Clostridium uliginosum]SFD11246.1 hypothetical protein SAMN05421842_12030 [Clostridium uliginosum]